MKILITNTVALNGGDAAILLAIIDLLKLYFGDKTEIFVYDSQPEIAQKYYPDLQFRPSLYSIATSSFKVKGLGKVALYALRYANISRFSFAASCWSQGLKLFSNMLLSREEIQALVEYKSADLIISTGGTYLVESYALAPRILDYKTSLLLQRPLVFFTQSIGPFLQVRNQRTFKQIFNSSLLVLLRDELSSKHLNDIGVEQKNTCISSDVVFCLANKQILEEASCHKFSEVLNLKIAVSVRSWPHFKSISKESGMKKFQNSICSVVQHLVEKYNAEITFISTCQGIPEYWTDDSKLAAEIFSSLPEHVKIHVKVDNQFHDPKELLKYLKSFDLAIATRMHMCILSLSAGIPVFPIAYEFKTRELFRRLGLEAWVQDIETIDSIELIASVDSFLSSVNDIQAMLFQNVEKEREQAEASGSLVEALFKEQR